MNVAVIVLETFMEIADISESEDDRLEFKSSATPTKKLKQKIGQAISGFANSGGGVFVAGIDDSGVPDGGVPTTVGTTSLRDWVDQIAHQIEPTPVVNIHLVDDVGSRGTLQAGYVLLVIEVPKSVIGPHMAPDSKYYIRAGAHTLPARHFIVESIWSRRNFTHPSLIHRAEVFGYHSNANICIIELVALNDANALNVEIDVDPRPDGDRKPWPRRVPLIDKSHSFKVGFEIPTGGCEFALDVQFTDGIGNPFNYSVHLDTKEIHNSYKHDDSFDEPLARIARNIENIDRKLK